MSPTPLILFPCNGNSREIVGVVDALNAVRPQFDLLGFVDDQPHRWGTTLCGVPVLGGREVLEQYPHALVVAQPGSPSSFRQRCQIIDSLHLPKERFAPALIHPQATLGPGCELGRNVVLYAGVRLTAHVTVGDHCLVLSNSVLAHEVVMEDFAIVTSQVGVAGGVRVGRGCYVGSGALLGSDITLGTGALVGMGSVVLRDVPAREVWVGNPARCLRRVEETLG